MQNVRKMFDMKNIKKLLLIVCMLGLLTGCNSKESAKEETKNDITEKVEDNKLFDVSGNYKLAYKRVMQRALAESQSREWDNITYMLIDIDNNNVPELLVYYQGCEACTKIDYYTLDGSDAISLGSTSRYTNIYEKDNKYYTGKTGQGYDVISELTIDEKTLKETSVVEGKQLTEEHSKVEEFQKDLKRLEFKKITDFEYKDEEDDLAKTKVSALGVYYAISDDASSNTEWWKFNEDGTWERQASLCQGYALYKGTYVFDQYKGNDVIKAYHEKYTIYLKVDGDKIIYLESDILEESGSNKDSYPYTYLTMGGCSYIGAIEWQKNANLKIKYEKTGWSELGF